MRDELGEIGMNANKLTTQVTWLMGGVMVAVLQRANSNDC